MMREESKVILDLLRKRDVRVSISDGYKTPGFFVYEIEMDATQRFEKLEATLDDMERLLYAYRAKHRLIDPNDPEARVVCRAQKQPLTLEVNRPHVDNLPLDKLQLPTKPYVALAGMSYLTREGQPLVWNMADPSQPHALVAGGTGSGKSILLLDLVLSLATSTGPHQLGLYVVDGGNSTLLTLRLLPHLQVMATDVEGAINAVAQVKAIVLDRKSKSQTEPDHRCLLVVDELANLIAVMDKRQCEDFQRDLAIIAAEGRKFGVHMLVCTQKPLAETTGSLAKSNMAVRFVGAMASKTDANTAAGSPGTGAERLAGKGDFLRIIGGRARRFQAPMVDKPVGFIKKIVFKWSDTNRQSIASPTPLPQASKRDEIDVLADAVAPLLEQNMSKRQIARTVLQKDYVGSYAAKIDAAIQRCQSRQSATTAGATTPLLPATYTSDSGVSQSSSSRDGKIINLQRRAAGGD